MHMHNPLYMSSVLIELHLVADIVLECMRNMKYILSKDRTMISCLQVLHGIGRLSRMTLNAIITYIQPLVKLHKYEDSQF